MTKFENLVIGNAAGMVKTLDDVKRMCKSSATRITLGSITIPERRVEDGTANVPVSPGDVYFYDEETQESGNALGLPNMGMFKYGQLLEAIISMAHKAGKQLVVSVNGSTIEEILKLVSFVHSHGADGVEINLACPNVHDRGAQKPLMCQDIDLVQELIARIEKMHISAYQVGLKIAPTEDESLLDDLCSVINAAKVVRELVATNTRGGQRFIRNGVDMIAFKPPGSDTVVNTGGQAGAPLHASAVWVARTVRHFLDERVRVIGVGGIFWGKDAYDFVREDIGGIECATAHMKFGESLYAHIASGLLEHMPEAA